MNLKILLNTLLNDPVDIMRGVWKRMEPLVSDELFLKVQFKLAVGYWPDLKNPKSLNEKIQWLKLNTYYPEYAKLVDKYEVKKIVADIIGEKYIIPTYGIYNSIDTIEWDSLPEQFVVKATGDSGGIVICKDKKTFDRGAAIKKLKSLSEYNYYKYNKEYPYKELQTRYIAEAYIEDESGYELKDYKIFCFNGVPKFLFVTTGRQAGKVTFDFFDLEWNHIEVTNGHPQSVNVLKKPQKFKEMLEVASKLSKDLGFVRVDLYQDGGGNVRFGELTFFHGSGVIPFTPRSWDYQFGEYLILPPKNK